MSRSKSSTDVVPHRRSVTITRLCPPGTRVRDGIGATIVEPGREFTVRVSWWRWGSWKFRRRERVLGMAPQEPTSATWREQR